MRDDGTVTNWQYSRLLGLVGALFALTAVAVADEPVAGTVVIEAHALDENHAFDSIMLWLDAEPHLGSGQAPHRFELNTRSLTEGRHLIWVEAAQRGRVVGRSRRLALRVQNGLAEKPPGPKTLRLTFSTAELVAIAPRPARLTSARTPLLAKALPLPAKALTPGKPLPPSKSTSAPVAKAVTPPAAKLAPLVPAKATATPSKPSIALPAPRAKSGRRVAPPISPPTKVARPAPAPRKASAPTVGSAAVGSSLPQLQALAQIALAVAALLAGMNLMAVLTLRALLFVTVGRRRQLLMIWRPLLMESLDDGLTNDPTSILRRRMAIRKSHHGQADWIAFLHLWNHLHESRKVQSKDRLNEVAHVMRAHQVARGYLTSPELPIRMLAIATLGNMGERSAFEDLAKLAADPNSFLSLAAARALVHSDPHEAIHTLLPLVATRWDWAPGKVVSILKEAGLDHRSGTEVISAPLAEATLDSARVDLPRMVRLLASANCDSAQPTIWELLEQSSADEELLAVCLQSVRDAKGLALVRPYLEHPGRQVRLEALLALERLGGSTEAEAFINRLEDVDWWVRAQAAQAIARLPQASSWYLEDLRDRQHSDEARAALEQVLAERSVR